MQGRMRAQGRGGVRVRTFEPGDSARVAAIAAAAWQPVYDGYLAAMGRDMFAFYHAGWQERKAGEIARFCARENAAVWVAEAAVGAEGERGAGTGAGAAGEGGSRRGPEVAGFICCLLDAERRSGVICNNAVDPAFQRQGIGRLLNAYVLERMRERGIRFVSVSTGGGDDAHAPARKAYERAGFVVQIPQTTMFLPL